MRKSIYVLSVLLLTASFALASALQAQETDKQKQTKMQSGQVTAVDATNNQLVIKGEAGTDVTIMISANTTITKDGKTVTLAEVKAGDLVSTECEDASDHCNATSIQVSSAKVKPNK